ncbi:CBS domain-containing protein [Candidatus Woesearchaeota archaeon]|nr:CBS domain-containing protein [Candidatus Woesearchaeota archaeon]
MVKVRNIMSSNVVSIAPDSSIMGAARLIASKSVSSLVVMEKSKPIAIISENDVIKGVISGKANVRDVMSKNFMIISPSAKFADITKRLREEKIKRFPVVENDKLTGLITETDIIEATRDFTRFHQIVQEVILAVFGLATAFFLFYFSPFGASFFR